MCAMESKEGGSAKSAVGSVLSVGALTNHVLARHNECQGQFIACLAASHDAAVAVKDTTGVEWLAQEVRLRQRAMTACAAQHATRLDAAGRR